MRKPMTMVMVRADRGAGVSIMGSLPAVLPEEPLCPQLARHFRVALPDPHCRDVIVHGHLAELNGERESSRWNKSDARKAYAAAKYQNDMTAAYDLVDMVWDDKKENALFELIETMGKLPIYVLPHPGFDDEDCVDVNAGNRDGPTNALPFAHAGKLQSRIGGEVDSTIVQRARIGRTKLRRFQRFLWQPAFDGDVDASRPYVVVDDAFTLGGTLACLCAHIIGNGGTVVGATALAHKSGKNVPFALTQHTWSELHNEFGPDINRFWKDAIGHDASKLTNAEGSFLVDWRHQSGGPNRNRVEGLQSLRTRLLKVRDTGQ